MPVRFFTEDVDEPVLAKRKISDWIKACCTAYHHRAGNINFIFCSDEYLKNINIQFLDHYYYTDIITFNYNEGDTLSGDIYISTDRVTDNAAYYKVDFMNELLRVIIHGILHLNGFDDKTEKQKSSIHILEDEWLNHFRDN